MSKARGLADLGNVYDDGALSNRSLIINGAMTVAQRGNSTGVTATGYYGPDRFQFNESGRDQFQVSISQASDGPEGFANSWKMETTTVETAVDATEYVLCIQRMEGQNLQHLKYGTSNAQQVTASFWVKSSVAADYGIYMYSGDGVRIIGSTYTINSANTWEYKTVTFAGDTGGTLNDDNGDALYLGFVLAAGSNMSDTDNTSWSAYASGKLAFGHTANALLTTANATWQITGVQLEVGDTATPFEHRSYSDEIQRCMRYYEKQTFSGGYQFVCNSINTNTTQVEGFIPFMVEKRASPTITSSAASTWRVNALVNDATASGINWFTGTPYGVRGQWTRSSGTHTMREASYINVENASPNEAYVNLDAEL
jgi:hypothetical protein